MHLAGSQALTSKHVNENDDDDAMMVMPKKVARFGCWLPPDLSMCRWVRE